MKRQAVLLPDGRLAIPLEKGESLTMGLFEGGVVDVALVGKTLEAHAARDSQQITYTQMLSALPAGRRKR